MRQTETKSIFILSSIIFPLFFSSWQRSQSNSCSSTFAATKYQRNKHAKAHGKYTKSNNHKPITPRRCENCIYRLLFDRKNKNPARIPSKNEKNKKEESKEIVQHYEPWNPSGQTIQIITDNKSWLVQLTKTDPTDNLIAPCFSPSFAPNSLTPTKIKHPETKMKRRRENVPEWKNSKEFKTLQVNPQMRNENLVAVPEGGTERCGF